MNGPGIKELQPGAITSRHKGGWPRGRPRNQVHPRWQECREKIVRLIELRETSWRDLAYEAGMHFTSLREAVVKDYKPKPDCVAKLLRYMRTFRVLQEGQPPLLCNSLSESGESL